MGPNQGLGNNSLGPNQGFGNNSSGQNQGVGYNNLGPNANQALGNNGFGPNQALGSGTNSQQWNPNNPNNSSTNPFLQNAGRPYGNPQSQNALDRTFSELNPEDRIIMKEILELKGQVNGLKNYIDDLVGKPRTSPPYPKGGEFLILL